MEEKPVEAVEQLEKEVAEPIVEETLVEVPIEEEAKAEIETEHEVEFLAPEVTEKEAEEPVALESPERETEPLEPQVFAEALAVTEASAIGAAPFDEKEIEYEEKSAEIIEEIAAEEALQEEAVTTPEAEPIHEELVEPADLELSKEEPASREFETFEEEDFSVAVSAKLEAAPIPEPVAMEKKPVEALEQLEKEVAEPIVEETLVEVPIEEEAKAEIEKEHEVEFLASKVTEKEAEERVALESPERETEALEPQVFAEALAVTEASAIGEAPFDEKEIEYERKPADRFEEIAAEEPVVEALVTVPVEEPAQQVRIEPLGFYMPNQQPESPEVETSAERPFEVTVSFKLASSPIHEPEAMQEEPTEALEELEKEVPERAAEETLTEIPVEEEADKEIVKEEPEVELLAPEVTEKEAEEPVELDFKTGVIVSQVLDEALFSEGSDDTAALFEKAIEHQEKSAEVTEEISVEEGVEETAVTKPEGELTQGKLIKPVCHGFSKEEPESRDIEILTAEVPSLVAISSKFETCLIPELLAMGEKLDEALEKLKKEAVPTVGERLAAFPSETETKDDIVNQKLEIKFKAAKVTEKETEESVALESPAREVETVKQETLTEKVKPTEDSVISQSQELPGKELEPLELDISGVEIVTTEAAAIAQSSFAGKDPEQEIEFVKPEILVQKVAIPSVLALVSGAPDKQQLVKETEVHVKLLEEFSKKKEDTLAEMGSVLKEPEKTMKGFHEQMQVEAESRESSHFTVGSTSHTRGREICSDSDHSVMLSLLPLHMFSSLPSQFTPACEVSEEVMPDGSIVKRKLIKTCVKRLVTRKVRRVCPDGRVTEQVTTEELPEAELPDTGNIQTATSSFSDAIFAIPSASLESSLPSSDTLHAGTRMYTDTVEGEPQIEKHIQEFKETLPDGRIVIRKVVRTRQKQTIVKRIVVEGPRTEETVQVEPHVSNERKEIDPSGKQLLVKKEIEQPEIAEESATWLPFVTKSTSSKNDIPGEQIRSKGTPDLGADVLGKELPYASERKSSLASSFADFERESKSQEDSDAIEKAQMEDISDHVGDISDEDIEDLPFNDNTKLDPGLEKRDNEFCLPDFETATDQEKQTKQQDSVSVLPSSGSQVSKIDNSFQQAETSETLLIADVRHQAESNLLSPSEYTLIADLTPEEELHQVHLKCKDATHKNLDELKDMETEELHSETAMLKLDLYKSDTADDHVSTSSSEMAQLEDVCLSQEDTAAQESYDDEWELVGEQDIQQAIHSMDDDQQE